MNIARYRLTRWCVLAIIVVAAAAWPRAGIYQRNYEGVLGTSMELKVLASSAGAASKAEAAVLDEIDRESHVLSGYDPSSEFWQWLTSSGTPTRVSTELFEVLDLFDRWRVRTGGALDAAAETVSAVWRQAATVQQLPTEAALAHAVTETNRQHWTLNFGDRTATHLDASPLMLNSFTKSFIIDRAADAAMHQPGVKGIVVNVGGDLVVRGQIEDTVDITDPRANADNARPLQSLTVRGGAVATSGSYRRGFDIQGAHYSHIVDPRTGHPAGHVLSATVVAPIAADAGALATAFCVLNVEDSERLATTVPGAEFLLVLADGREIESSGWRQMVQLPAESRSTWAPVAALKAAEQATGAKPAFELTVSIEIAQQQMRAQRPYVAVWIEDKDRFPVRTLAVWYMERESRYLTDLKAWYRGDRLRNMAEGTEILRSVSSATRGPGRYTLVWDGTDTAGQPVKPGTYTVLIEAAREHGTYQIMRQDMDFSGVARKIELPGNVEISAATLDYHRVGK